MNETQGYTAEYAALSHEIYSLTKQLEEKEKEYRESTKTDLHDPFKNQSSDNAAPFHEFVLSLT